MPLVSPWTEMGLQTDGAVVDHADPERLSLRWTGQQEVAEPIGQSLEGAGWTLKLDTAGNGLVARTYHKDDQRLALSVVYSPPMRLTTAAFTISDLPADPKGKAKSK